jgi:VIT1/CCC1 family predicted Fe2+/Mn2+ transporter
MLRVNDGLVSTFLLVAGVAGGALSLIDILLMAISEAIIGAVNIVAGEFVATTKSQNDRLRGKIALERRHIQTNRHDENV